jgi:hypothetical protein
LRNVAKQLLQAREVTRPRQTLQFQPLPKEALTVLINQVAAAADGTATVTLSGEISDGQGLGPPPDTPAPQLCDALSVVSATMTIAATSLSTATT